MMKQLVLKREDIHKGYLILVNQANPLIYQKQKGNPHNTEHSFLCSVDHMYPDVLLEWKTAHMLVRAWKAAGAKDRIVPVSGYRTLEEQKQIYEDSLKTNGEEFTRKYVALPDTSEHQTGLAIDLGEKAEQIDFVRPDFPDTGVCGIFKNLAAEYGFIQRYEAEKEHITGIACEPWHFRYVGRPHAHIMKINHWCLEEYVEHLKAYPFDNCFFPADNGTRICYLDMSGQTERVIEVEDRWDVQISGNNDDGFILTLSDQSAQ